MVNQFIFILNLMFHMLENIHFQKQLLQFLTTIHIVIIRGLGPDLHVKPTQPGPTVTALFEQNS